MKKFNHYTCSEYQDLLIQNNMENLSGEQRGVLQKHLKTCPNCRQFQIVLTNLYHTMKVEKGKSLTPAPHIRQAIIEKMAQSQAKRINIVDELLQKIWRLLDYRIPIYQSLLGALLITFLLWGVISLPFASSSKISQYPFQLQIEKKQLKQMNVLNSLEVIDAQKMGTTVKEDTILIHFFYSAR